MEIDLKGKNIAVIGGTGLCKTILEILTGEVLKEAKISVLLVADTDSDSEGIQYARQIGIPTTADLSEIARLSSLDLVLNLLPEGVPEDITTSIASGGTAYLTLDPFKENAFLKLLKTEEEKYRAKQEILKHKLDNEKVEDIFEDYSRRISQITDQTLEQLQNVSENLVESEKELSQVIHGSMIPTFVINKDHIITHWNRALEELTGSKAYELVGTDKQWVPFRSAKRPTMADIIVGEMSEHDITKFYGNSWRKSSLIKEAYEAEEFFPHLGDNGKWIFFSAAPIKSHDGNVIGAIETLRDTSEEKKRQEELALQDRELSYLYDKYKKSEEKYRSLFNNNPNPIFIIDRKTLEILDINHRVEDDYGYSKKELLGMPYLGLCDKNDESFAMRIRNIADNESILLTKRKHFKKGHTSFFVNIKVCAAEYAHQDVIIVSATDITESVEKETLLIQAGKLATLGTMAAGMAHEINQPLNVIQICADLMLKMIKKGITISEEDLQGMAKDIIDNVARAAGVIKHVRDFARQSERDFKKMSINDPINDVFKVLGHQLINHQIEVSLNLDPDLPEIKAEHNRLEQVFINLVTNAIDSMDEKAAQSPENPVEKKLSIESFVEDGKVVVTVSDTGVGMTEEVRNKIFEPFFTTKETGKGTGLGTSISFGIIKDYHGTIDIRSEYGKGATFIIRFPLAPQTEKAL